MGSSARVTVTAPPGGPDPRRLAAWAQGRITELESRWSRFIPGSEVSRLNAAGGRPVPVSSETQILVRLAVEGWFLTEGAFDPTVLESMLALGYRRTFDAVQHDPDSPVVPVGRAHGCDAIEAGRDGATVRLPRGVGFDPGGIGKGLAADLVVEQLLAAGAAGACVEIGGDVRVAGEAPEHAGWVVRIDHPRPECPPLGEAWLCEGGVASSSVLRRQWIAGGDRHHHLMDPSTGHSTCNDILGASVIARTAWLAEVLATATCVRGTGLAIARAGAAGVLVPSRSDPQYVNGFAVFVR
jgi:thiamine biosynthesis lipoprotein